MTSAADSSRNGIGRAQWTPTGPVGPAGTGRNGNGSKPTDLLSPGEIARDEMAAAGIDIWVEPVAEPAEFEVYDTPEILTFEVPPMSTLPVLGRDGLIMEGGTNLLYSYPKLGKTELLTALTHEWVQGRRVLYLTEEPMPNWKRRLAAHRFTPADFTLRMAYTWGFDIHKAVRLIESETFDVLVVDTLRNAVGFLEGDGDKDVVRVMVPLFKAAAGKTIICSYHARKMPGDGGRDISGHHSLYGTFDRALQLTGDSDRPDQRKITVSGRCMYEGDFTLHYRQVRPGVFEPLDGQTLTEPKERATYELQCLGCGEIFMARRRDARTCSVSCRQRYHRNPTVSEPPVSQNTSPPIENEMTCDSFLDGEW